jgi:hypothetical protein
LIFLLRMLGTWSSKDKSTACWWMKYWMIGAFSEKRAWWNARCPFCQIVSSWSRQQIHNKNYMSLSSTTINPLLHCLGPLYQLDNVRQDIW